VCRSGGGTLTDKVRTIRPRSLTDGRGKKEWEKTRTARTRERGRYGELPKMENKGDPLKLFIAMRKAPYGKDAGGDKTEDKKIICVRQDFGRVHDFRLFKESIGHRTDPDLRMDVDVGTGYTGFSPEEPCAPKRRSKNHPLSKREKGRNRRIIAAGAF